MEPEYSLPHSQVHATCPYPGEAQNIKSMPPQPSFWKVIFVSSFYA
jgi:hypothetical protein